MSVLEIETFFDQSLTGTVCGVVNLAGREHRYRQWSGEKLRSRLLGFDTETEVVDAPVIPRLAIATAYDGHVCYMIHPSDLGRFIQKHAKCNFVGHNIAGFDYHVVRQHLEHLLGQKACRAWFRIADRGRFACTMLLDQLVRLGRGSGYPRQRDLGTVARSWADIPDLDKKDPWRTRFGETIGVDWRTVDHDAWGYACKDAIAVRNVFLKLRRAARQLVKSLGIDHDLVEKYGLLSQRIQLRAAIVLSDIHHRGICIDPARRDDAEQTLKGEMDRLVNQIHGMPQADGVFKRYKRTGELQYTASGKPRTDNGQLAELLTAIADEAEIVVPTTPRTGKPTLARQFWEQHVDADPFIDAWVRLDETSKLSQFFAGLQAKRVHPRYTTLVRTGRTSCQKPNIQQIPRSSNFREMFVPSSGHVFLIIDYSALELRTLAAECEQRFGESTLADVIRAGTDPHAHTAALLLGMELDEFLAVEKSDPKRFKLARQRAKAINFGVPGGLGSRSLSSYAKLTYGVDLSEDEAAEFRERFLYEIYPEIGEYMESDLTEVAAQNLRTTVGRVRREFPDDGLICGAKNVVQGRKRKRDGSPYNLGFIEQVWDGLLMLNRNPDLELALENRKTGEELEHKLFFGTVITATGRARGIATFTQRRNTPFQGMAADGTKIALWNLYKAGYRIVAFVHDEFVVELPEDVDYAKEATRIDEICCRSMEEVTGSVPIGCEYALSRRWSKDAAEVWDEDGRLVPWGQEPERIAATVGTIRLTKSERDNDSSPAEIDKSPLPSPRTPKPVKKLYKPLKWHGGKEYLAKRIVALMPDHVHYVEPFFGSGAVLLSKNPEGISEVANDIYGELMNFWTVLQDQDKLLQLQLRLELTPVSKETFETATDLSGDDVERAAQFFIRNRQSRQGLMHDFATLSRNRTRRGMNEQVSSYLGAIDGLAEVHQRLQRVVILNQDALDVIRQQDGANTLFYCDPPYLHETRTTTSDYQYEMNVADHKRLLDALRQCRGKVMLSGYPSDLYDRELADWNREDLQIDNKASSKGTKDIKTECVWMNY
jgi:DNA adenine methylase